MWINGIETPVLIDDYVPTFDNRPAFAKTKSGGGLWVILLEKAWCKLLGGYSRAISGFPEWAFDHLTGFASYPVRHESIKVKLDKFWIKRVECDKKGYKCTASSDGSGEKVNSKGIVGGHAYGLLAVYEVNV